MEEINANAPLKEWRQGDLILAPFHLPVIVGQEGDQSEAKFLPAEHGIAIVSQSCDIVKAVGNCPYVQVAPLVPIDDDEASQILRGKRPRHVIIPALKGMGLAIDLDACATVTKEAIAASERLSGCPDDHSQSRLSRSLARHRGRFAFPDTFNNEIAKPIADWISEKYKRDSAQGRLVNAITEVRVTTDDWSNPTFLTFHLLCDQLPDISNELVEAIDRLTIKASKSKEYPDPELILTTFDDISAAEYRQSIELDWDGLSPS